MVHSVYLASMAGVSSGRLEEVIETLFEVELALSKWRTLDDKKHPSGSLTFPSTGKPVFCTVTDMMLSVQSQRNNAGSISTGYIIPSLNDVHCITVVPCTKLLVGIVGYRAERVIHGRMLILQSYYL